MKQKVKNPLKGKTEKRIERRIEIKFNEKSFNCASFQKLISSMFHFNYIFISFLCLFFKGPIFNNNSILRFNERNN